MSDPIYSAKNDEDGVEARVTKTRTGAYLITLHDVDADLELPTQFLANKLEQAKEKADFLAGVDNG